jgi:hypothetical protein
LTEQFLPARSAVLVDVIGVIKKNAKECKKRESFKGSSLIVLDAAYTPVNIRLIVILEFIAK